MPRVADKKMTAADHAVAKALKGGTTGGKSHGLLSVRFVQVFTSNQFWDNHGSIRTSLLNACKKTDKPAAALVRDLKQRSLLDTTLVTWGGEMGRLPVIQNNAGPAKVGRDHNTYEFTMWFAGGSIKGGHVHGATDEFGHHAVENKVSQHDFHATLLHLFGLDAKKLVYARNNQELSLLDGHEPATERWRDRTLGATIRN